MKVKDAMYPFHSIPGHFSVADAAREMDRRDIGSVLVFEGNKPIGVMTERDLLRKIVAPGRDPTKTMVKEIMSSPIITISEDAEISDAARVMDEKRIRRIAVVNSKGEIIGKITANSIARNVQNFSVGRLISESRRNGYFSRDF